MKAYRAMGSMLIELGSCEALNILNVLRRFMLRTNGNILAL